MNIRRNNMLYRAIPDGATFRVLAPSQERPASGKVVLNDSTYKKVGNSHAVDIHTNKDVILSLNTRCWVAATNGETRGQVVS